MIYDSSDKVSDNDPSIRNRRTIYIKFDLYTS